MIPHFLSRERRFLLWFFTSGPGSEIQTEHSLLINEDRDYIVIGQDRISIKRAKDLLKIKDRSGMCPSIERLAFSETLPTEKDYILTGNIKTTKGSPGMLRARYNIGDNIYDVNGNIKTTKGSPGMLRARYNIGDNIYDVNGNIIPENTVNV